MIARTYTKYLTDSVIAITIIMIFVVPQLSVFLKSQKIALPFYTTALMGTSEFVQNSWYYITLGPVILFLILKIVRSASPNAAYMLDKLVLELPVFGNILKKIEFSRFCHFFAMTYKSGIHIIECLQICQDVVKNKFIYSIITHVISMVSEGEKLHQALRTSNIFPPLVLQMFKVGENSGKLDESIVHVNTFYDNEINTTIDSVISMIQPILTVVMGGVLVWMTLAVFGPIYSNFGKNV